MGPTYRQSGKRDEMTAIKTVIFGVLIWGNVMAKTQEEAVNGVLDKLHHFASVADGDAYFSLFTDDGVFLGTDSKERWNLSEFKRYAQPHFQKKKGWTYRKTERQISIHQSVAWFDELLINATYGVCRGSGVLIQIKPGVWKISQYNLSIPIPNDLAKKFTKEIQDYDGKPPS